MMNRLFALLLLCSASAVAADQLLVFGDMVDGTGERMEANEILVRGNRIAAVGRDLEATHPEAELTDLSHLTVLPGFVDVHVHLTYGFAGDPGGRAWAVLFDTPPEERLVAAVRNAKATLRTGVTTVRDLFAFDGVDRHLKALVDAGVVEGPRIFSAGTGLHPLTVPSPAQRGEDFDLPAYFREHAKQRAEEGGSWVKVFATTGSASDLTATQNFFYPELKALTDTAHGLGLRVAVHAYGPSAVPDALRAGVDSLDHPVGVSDELLAWWAKTDTWYVPTVDHNRYYAEYRQEYGFDKKTERELQEFAAANLETLRSAYRHGVKIAFGSDAVMSMFGQNTREIAWLEKAGIPPADIIRITTLNGAELLGQSGRIGRIREGYLADLVAVQGDPLVDVMVLVEDVAWIMKDGAVVTD